MSVQKKEVNIFGAHETSLEPSCRQEAESRLRGHRVFAPAVWYCNCTAITTQQMYDTLEKTRPPPKIELAHGSRVTGERRPKPMTQIHAQIPTQRSIQHPRSP